MISKPIKHHAAVAESIRKGGNPYAVSKTTMNELAEHYGVNLSPKGELYLCVPLGSPSRGCRESGKTHKIVKLANFASNGGVTPKIYKASSHEEMNRWEVLYRESISILDRR